MSKFSKQEVEVLKRELDHWDDKFSMDSFVIHIAKVLNFKKLSKGTIYNLMKDYPEIKSRVDSARARYRDKKNLDSSNNTDDQLLKTAQNQINMLKAEVLSLKSENATLQEKIIQMLYNAYYEKVNISNLNNPVDTREAVSVLSERCSQESIAFLDKPLPSK